MNNANVMFGATGMSQTAITGSILSFKLQKQGEVKEATDAANKFMAAAKGKEKRVASISVLLTASGSQVILPELLASATITNSSSGDCTGSWYVTGQPSIDWKNDDFAKADVELTQWLTATGTL